MGYKPLRLNAPKIDLALCHKPNKFYVRIDCRENQAWTNFEMKLINHKQENPVYLAR